MTPLYVLISLHKGYGLGDAVQMSAVLRHVSKHRPHWVVDYQAEEGKHQVGRGIVSATFAYGKPSPHEHYDAEVQIVLYDTWSNWGDRPNTRVSSCLAERFGLGWSAECGLYQVAVSDNAVKAARTLLYGWIGLEKKGRVPGREPERKRIVAVHYEGDSDQTRKNLAHSQVHDICRAIQHMDCEPVILDWRNRSPLGYRRLTTPADWGGDAEMVTAVISQCAAFVGIDSGPSKCASATDTPALVVWTGHHPAPFHDPAPNTTHLVPYGYHGLEPVCSDAGVIKWFEEHYDARQYDRNLVDMTEEWLTEVLSNEPSRAITN